MKLLFERSRPGRGNDLLPPCDVPVTQFDPSLLRGAPLRLPEIAEVDLGRHYTELAKQTHGVNDGFYPLGSCTMKYNPRVNEEAAGPMGSTPACSSSASTTSPGGMPPGPRFSSLTRPTAPTPPRPPWRDSRWSPFPPTRRAEWIWTPCARRWDRIPLA